MSQLSGQSKPKGPDQPKHKARQHANLCQLNDGTLPEEPGESHILIGIKYNGYIIAYLIPILYNTLYLII